MPKVDNKIIMKVSRKVAKNCKNMNEDKSCLVVIENDLGSESGVNIGSVVDGGRRSNIEDFFAPNSGVPNPVNIG